MRKLLLLTAVSLVPMGLAASAPMGLVQNEYAFAKAAADHGVRDAFLTYLDKQAMMLTPLPANAYAVYAQRKPSKSQLLWYPAYAVLSASGDFGVDTGPWTARWTEGGKKREAHGDWLTVWHRSKDGKWRILFDSGVDHAVPAQPPAKLPKTAKIQPLPPAGTQPDVEQVHWNLQRAESILSNTAVEAGTKAAYSGQGDDALLLLQEGSQSIPGRAQVVQAMSVQRSPFQWAPSGGSVATSSDLGYIYGMIYAANDDAHKKPLGGYAHVWKLEQGEWKLLIDLELPVPPPKQ